MKMIKASKTESPEMDSTTSDTYDKLWLVLPTETWGKLFSQAIDAKISVNEYLQILIEENEE